MSNSLHCARCYFPGFIQADFGFRAKSVFNNSFLLITSHLITFIIKKKKKKTGKKISYQLCFHVALKLKGTFY